MPTSGTFTKVPVTPFSRYVAYTSEKKTELQRLSQKYALSQE